MLAPLVPCAPGALRPYSVSNTIEITIKSTQYGDSNPGKFSWLKSEQIYGFAL